MPNYNISVVFDPSNVVKGVDVVEKTMDKLPRKATQVQTSIQRAFDFNTGPAVAGAGAVEKAMAAVGSSADAAGNRVEKAMDKAADAAVKGNNRIKDSARQTAQAQLQLGQQFNDFSTQVLGGGSAITAFAQQSGQAAFALANMGGRLGSIGAFLAGPWGTLLVIGTTILSQFVAKMLDNTKATEEAEKALAKFQQRQSDIGNFIDSTTGKLKEQNRTLILNAQLTRQQQIDENNRVAKESGSGAFGAANAQANPLARGSAIDRFLAASAIQGGASPDDLRDPDVQRAIDGAGGSVDKLATSIARLAQTTRPDLKGLALDISNQASAAIIATRENERLGKELKALNGDTTALTNGTAAAVERQVALATATTAVERAAARLQEVRAKGNAIDKIDDPAARTRALEGYRIELTAATRELDRATKAQSEGAKAASAHTRELAKQGREAERVKDFLANLADRAAALDQRGTAGITQGQVDAFGRQFNRSPSAGERQQIEDAVRKNQLLIDEKSILDNLRGPLEIYARQQAALADLLARGRISQAEFNRELAALPLSQALQSVDASLTGTLTQYDAQVQQIRDNIEKALAVVDAAEKAGLLGKADAQQRREDLRGPDQPADGSINVRGGGTADNLQSRQLQQLARQRRDTQNDLDQRIGGQVGRDAQREQARNRYNDDLQQLRDFYGRKYAEDERYGRRKRALDQRLANEERNFRQQDRAVALQSASETFQSLADIAEGAAGKQSAAYKAMFAVSKAFAIAESIVKIQQGIANALSLPFPANLGAAAAVAASAASIVSNIQAVALNFKDGGYVSGPGGSRSDSIPANLSNGEFVVNAQATQANRSLLEAINSGRRPRAANDGGGGDLYITTGDIIVQGTGNDGPAIGRDVKEAIKGLVRQELGTQARSGGALTRTKSSVMSG